MKILLAVDGSPYTKKMLAYLATHAEMFGNKNTFSLLNVQLPLPPRARAAVGADVVKARGGSVHSLKLVDGFSTTALVERIRKG